MVKKKRILEQLRKLHMKERGSGIKIPEYRQKPPEWLLDKLFRQPQGKPHGTPSQRKPYKPGSIKQAKRKPSQRKPLPRDKESPRGKNRPLLPRGTEPIHLKESPRGIRMPYRPGSIKPPKRKPYIIGSIKPQAPKRKPYIIGSTGKRKLLKNK